MPGATRRSGGVGRRCPAAGGRASQAGRAARSRPATSCLARLRSVQRRLVRLRLAKPCSAQPPVLGGRGAGRRARRGGWNAASRRAPAGRTPVALHVAAAARPEANRASPWRCGAVPREGAAPGVHGVDDGRPRASCPAKDVTVLGAIAVPGVAGGVAPPLPPPGGRPANPPRDPIAARTSGARRAVAARRGRQPLHRGNGDHRGRQRTGSAPAPAPVTASVAAPASRRPSPRRPSRRQSSRPPSRRATASAAMKAGIAAA